MPDQLAPVATFANAANAPLPALAPLTLPEFDLLESVPPNPFFIFYDGSGEDQCGWDFPLYEQTDVGVFHLLFDRLGSNNILSLGAYTGSNNTAELTGFAESLFYLFDECSYDWRSRGVIFGYDSTYSVGAGTGAWRIQTNEELVKTIRFIWRVFDVDMFPIYGLKIKSHIGHPQNGHVDELAGAASTGTPCPQARTKSTSDLLDDVKLFFRLNSAHFQPLSSPNSIFVSDVDSPQEVVNQVYDNLAAACRSLFDLVLSFLPLIAHISIRKC